MTPRTFPLPDLGEGLAEAELVRWLVRVGDTVAVDDPVAEVETAKAAVEIPSPFAGTVAELHGEPGTTVAVGAPLFSVETEKVSVETEPADGPGNVLVGYGAPPTSAPRRGATERPKVKSPVVRRLARERGVDLAALTGTGPDGLITRADVERAATRLADVDRRTGLPIRAVVPISGARKAAADTLTRSRRDIPEATTWVDVDATALLELRDTLGGGPEPAPGLLALVARFVVAGLRRYPELNARLVDNGTAIARLDGVNLGIATQTDRGLVVPSVRDAHRLGARGLDGEIRRLVAAARAGTATPAELSGGSFTLNNYGGFGVDGSAAIINHPEVAILGIGRIIPRPWVVGGQLVARHIGQLSLVFDHRVCDGGTAAGFLRYLADAIEAPVPALADL